MPELHETIVAPLVTEKSSAAYAARKAYAFRVHRGATKPQTRAAIEARDTGDVLRARWRGARHRPRDRMTELRVDRFATPDKVSGVECDAVRTGRIALHTYGDGEKRDVLDAKRLNVGDSVVLGPGPDS